MMVVKMIAAAVLLLMVASLFIKTACDRPATWPEPKPPRRLRCWGSKRR